MVKCGPRFPLRRKSTPRPPPPPKLALLIGCDYVGSPDLVYPPLYRARKDTRNFRKLLITKYDYLPENIVMMLDGEDVEPNLQPTRANILREIRKLVKDAREGSRFVFFYSGHSGQVESPDNDEEDGLDEFLVPVDHRQHPEATETRKRMILDNKLRKLLVDSLPVGAHLTAIFDSCHSGTMLDLDHYLCNNVYHPWTNLPFRRSKTKWLAVRRKNGEHMSQSDVRVITKKRVQPDKQDRVGSASSQPSGSRKGSACSVRIYQRKRVSENEVQVFDTSVDVADSEDGRKRRFSVQSRRASVQRKPSLSISQVIDGAQSMDSLDEDGEGGEFGLRCASPTMLGTCDGFNCSEGGTLPSASVLSISSCQDSQRMWETKKTSFTQWVIELLRMEPHQPIGKFIHELTHKMYGHAQKTHKWSQEQKDAYKNHLREISAAGSSTSVETTVSARRQVHAKYQTEEALDELDYDTVPEPQLGALERLDMSQPMIL